MKNSMNSMLSSEQVRLIEEMKRQFQKSIGISFKAPVFLNTKLPGKY